MQYQMSGAPAPTIVPQPAPAPLPAAVPPPVKQPRRTFAWLLLAVLGIGGAAIWWATRAQETTGGGPPGVAATPTATAWSGGIQKTIRLTGSTGAERFAALISPQMRGSRGGFGREGRSFGGGNSGGGGSNSGSGGSSSGGSGGGSSSGSSSLSTASGTTGTGTTGGGTGTEGTVASTSSAQSGGLNSGSSLSSALRSSTSRVSRPPSKAPSSSSRTTSGGGSSALGSDGLGSTSSNLMGGGNNSGGGGGGGGAGGGGMGEFGLILQEVVKPGTMVKKGQEVAEFDRQSMLNRLDDYRASVAQTEASFKKLQAELEVAKQAHQHTIAVAKGELEKARLDLKAIPVLGTIDSERLRLAAEEAEARYKQLLAEVKHVEVSQKAELRNAELEFKQMQLELKRAEANAERLRLKAPIDGLTVMQNIFRGTEMAQIQAGDQLWPGMMFMQIVDTSSMVVNASVNQVDIERLRIGAKARIRFDAFPDLELPGHVFSIGAITRPGGMRAQFVKEVPVKLKLDRMDPRVIPDLSVSVDVILEEAQADAILPLGAIFRDADSADAYVYVKNGEAWERRKVELGLADNVSVAIRSGIRKGETVALEPPAAKKEGGGGSRT